jgi:hypothetical protein
MHRRLNRTLTSVAIGLTAALVLTPALARAADNAPIDRTTFKRECEARGGVFTEGKTSAGRTIWVCVKDGKIIADCDLDAKGYGGCTGPSDWPMNVDDGAPAAGGGPSRPASPAQHVDQGPNSPPAAGGPYGTRGGFSPRVATKETQSP